MAAEGRYHADCYTRFSLRKLAQETEARKTGKNKIEEMIMLFEKTCMWLESDISIHSVQEFRRKMIERCKEEDKDKVYDARYIKKFRKNRHDNFIWFKEEVGKESLICFKNMTEYY